MPRASDALAQAPEKWEYRYFEIKHPTETEVGTDKALAVVNKQLGAISAGGWEYAGWQHEVKEASRGTSSLIAFKRRHK